MDEVDGFRLWAKDRVTSSSDISKVWREVWVGSPPSLFSDERIALASTDGVILCVGDDDMTFV